MPRLHKLAQRAGIVCNEGAFAKFLGVEGKDAATKRLRRLCEISSRKELDTDPEAAERFTQMMSQYESWLRE